MNSEKALTEHRPLPVAISKTYRFWDFFFFTFGVMSIRKPNSLKVHVHILKMEPLKMREFF